MQNRRSKIFLWHHLRSVWHFLPVLVAGKSRLCRLFLSHRYSHCDAGSKSTMVFQFWSKHQVCLLHRSPRAFPALWQLAIALCTSASAVSRVYARNKIISTLTVLSAITWCAPVDQFCAFLFCPVSWFSMEENKLSKR